MVCFSNLEHSSEVLQTMFVTQKHTDIVLVAGASGEKLPAHKSVVCAATDYFDTMFSSGFIEAEQKEVTINDVEPEAFRAMIKFLYCGLIEIENVEMATAYWAAAELLKIPKVVKYAQEFIGNNLKTEYCLSLWLIARKNGNKTLEENSFKYAVTEFENVIKEKEFLKLDLDILIGFATAFHDSVTEDIFVAALLKWIDHDLSERTSHFKDLLPLIDVDLIKVETTLNSLYAKCTNSEELLFISHALKKRCFNNNLLSQLQVPKSFNSGEEMVIIVEETESKKSVWQINVVTKDHSKFSIEVDGKVIGVSKGNFVLVKENLKTDIILLFDHKTKLKRSLKCTAVLKNMKSSQIHGDKLYVLMEAHVTQIDLNTGEHLHIQNLDYVKVLDFAVFEQYIYVIRITGVTEIMSSYCTDSKMWNFNGDLLNKSGQKVIIQNEDWYAVAFTKRIVKYGLNGFNTKFYDSVLAVNKRIFAVEGRKIQGYSPTSDSLISFWEVAGQSAFVVFPM